MRGWRGQTDQVIRCVLGGREGELVAGVVSDVGVGPVGGLVRDDRANVGFQRPADLVARFRRVAAGVKDEVVEVVDVPVAGWLGWQHQPRCAGERCGSGSGQGDAGLQHLFEPVELHEADRGLMLGHAVAGAPLLAVPEGAQAPEVLGGLVIVGGNHASFAEGGHVLLAMEAEHRRPRLAAVAYRPAGCRSPTGPGCVDDDPRRRDAQLVRPALGGSGDGVKVGR